MDSGKKFVKNKYLKIPWFFFKTNYSNKNQTYVTENAKNVDPKLNQNQMILKLAKIEKKLRVKKSNNFKNISID